MSGPVATRVQQEIGDEWGSLKPRGMDWPAPIRRAVQDLDIWLHGENVEYIQLDYRVPDDSFGFVEDATEFTIFILTERYAALVVLPRPERGYMEPHQRHLVPRSSLSELTSSLPPLSGLYEGLTFELKYPGFPRSITVRPSDPTSSQPSFEDEKDFFAGLRDDFFAED